MKDTHFYGHIREFAQRKAMIARQDAQAWDILARDILREKHRIEAKKRNKPVQPKVPPPEETFDLEGRLPVTKRGRKTCIAMKDIHAWFEALPDK